MSPGGGKERMGLFTESNFILKLYVDEWLRLSCAPNGKVGSIGPNRQDLVPKDRSSEQTVLWPDQNEVQGDGVVFCNIRVGAPRVNEAEGLRPIRFGHHDARRNKCRSFGSISCHACLAGSFVGTILE